MIPSVVNNVRSNLKAEEQSRNENKVNRKICFFYLKKNCRHIKKKTTCRFSHPKLCPVGSISAPNRHSRLYNSLSRNPDSASELLHADNKFYSVNFQCDFMVGLVLAFKRLLCHCE